MANYLPIKLAIEKWHNEHLECKDIDDTIENSTEDEPDFYVHIMRSNGKTIIKIDAFGFNQGWMYQGKYNESFDMSKLIHNSSRSSELED